MRAPRFLRFILLVGLSNTLLVVSILDILYDCHLRSLLQLWVFVSLGITCIDLDVKIKIKNIYLRLVIIYEFKIVKICFQSVINKVGGRSYL